MAMMNLKAMQKEKDLNDGDADNKKPSLLKRKPFGKAEAPKSGLAARLTGKK